MCDLELSHRGHRTRAADRQGQRGARARAAWSARTTGCRTSGSLPTAFPASRCRSISRIRGWRNSSSRRCSKSKAATTDVPEDPAPRGRARDRQRVPAAPPADAPRGCSAPGDALSRVLHAEAVQQELRPAPRSLVRAEPSRRGLRRDVRRVARSRSRVGDAATPDGRRSGSCEYMDRLMRELAQRRPRVTIEARGRSAVASARRRWASTTAPSASTTASTHPDFYDCGSAAICSPTRREYAEEPVGGAIRPPDPPRGAQHGRQLHRQLSVHHRSADRARSSTRCRELNLRLTESEEATKMDFMVFLTVQTMNYLHSGRHRVAL